MDLNRPEGAEAVGADVVNVDELAWSEWSHGQRFGGRVKAIANSVGATRIGVVLEELPPGRQSSPTHYHMKEEEHVWVLAGRAVLRLGDAEHLLKKGDYVCFRAATAVGHCLINKFDEPCVYLVVGERRKDDVIVYPDSNKLKVRLLDEVYQKKPVDYWLDEKP